MAWRRPTLMSLNAKLHRNLFQRHSFVCDRARNKTPTVRAYALQSQRVRARLPALVPGYLLDTIYIHAMTDWRQPASLLLSAAGLGRRGTSRFRLRSLRLLHRMMMVPMPMVPMVMVVPVGIMMLRGRHMINSLVRAPGLGGGGLRRAGGGVCRTLSFLRGGHGSRRVLLRGICSRLRVLHRFCGGTAGEKQTCSDQNDQRAPDQKFAHKHAPSELGRT